MKIKFLEDCELVKTWPTGMKIDQFKNGDYLELSRIDGKKDNSDLVCHSYGQPDIYYDVPSYLFEIVPSQVTSSWPAIGLVASGVDNRELEYHLSTLDLQIKRGVFSNHVGVSG